MPQLANLLKNDELSRLSISNLKIDFKIEQGNIIVGPFTTNIAGNPTTFSGSQTVDGKMDYTMSMNIARKYFGKDIDKPSPEPTTFNHWTLMSNLVVLWINRRLPPIYLKH